MSKTFSQNDRGNILSLLRNEEHHLDDLADLATDEHIILFQRGESSGVLKAICIIKDYFNSQVVEVIPA